MKTTNKSTVDYVDHLGTDLTIVNAARVSFDKESDWEYETPFGLAFTKQEGKTVDRDFGPRKLSKQDEKLIKYLAKHNHWSPFAHTSIQLRVNTPIFVARQLVKHQVGGVWNEVSRRYVDDEPVFYFPDKWRKRAENVKQGSSDTEIIQYSDLSDTGLVLNIDEETKFTCAQVVYLYNDLVASGVAPEQARMILPQNMMTSWYWTGSLMFFHRVFKQRTDSHAQLESREVAEQIGDICEKLFPVSWKALCSS